MRKKENRLQYTYVNPNSTAREKVLAIRWNSAKSMSGIILGEEYADCCTVFEDKGFSGGNLQRPDLKRMIEDVRKHKYKVIVV